MCTEVLTTYLLQKIKIDIRLTNDYNLFDKKIKTFSLNKHF